MRAAMRAARRITSSPPGAPGDRHHDAFTSFPLALDAVRLAIRLERLVDTVGDPHEGELTQGTQVALAEVVGE